MKVRALLKELNGGADGTKRKGYEEVALAVQTMKETLMPTPSSLDAGGYFYCTDSDVSPFGDLEDHLALLEGLESDPQSIDDEHESMVLLSLKDRFEVPATLQPYYRNTPLALEDEMCGSYIKLEKLAERIDQCKKSVLVVCGAGISTSCGIPDFRSPKTGLYHNLQDLGLDTPESLFTLSFFREKPAPFYKWVSENWPGAHEPSLTHYFLSLLNKRGKLLRCYTQNIDSLECMAGLTQQSRLVQAHGNYSKAYVVDSDKEPSAGMLLKLKAALHEDSDPPGWQKLEHLEGGLVKPSIVFYEEDLPDRFHRLWNHDLQKCELLLVMGTSLQIQWAQDMVRHCQADIRALINDKYVQAPGTPEWDFFSESNCDDACRRLAKALGWENDMYELQQSMQKEREAILQRKKGKKNRKR